MPDWSPGNRQRDGALQAAGVGSVTSAGPEKDQVQESGSADLGRALDSRIQRPFYKEKIKGQTRPPIFTGSWG